MRYCYHCTAFYLQLTTVMITNQTDCCSQSSLLTCHADTNLQITLFNNYQDIRNLANINISCCSSILVVDMASIILLEYHLTSFCI